MVSRRAISWIVIAECQFIPRLHYDVLGTARLIFWYGCRCFPARHGKFRQCKRCRLDTARHSTASSDSVNGAGSARHGKFRQCKRCRLGTARHGKFRQCKRCRLGTARHGTFRQCKRCRLGTRAEIDRGLRSQRKPIKMKTREIKKSVLDNNSRWLCVIPDLFLTQHVTAIKFREKSLKNEMLHESIFSVQRIS